MDEELSLNVIQFFSKLSHKWFPIWTIQMEVKDLNPGPRRCNRWLGSVPGSAVCPKWEFVRMDCPKPQKSSNTLSPQFNFVRPHLAEVSFEGRASGFSVIPRSVTWENILQKMHLWNESNWQNLKSQSGADMTS